MFWDVIVSSLTYNISLLEYFQFRFYELNKSERRTFAGTGYMYEYQLIMNPKKARAILDNKMLFYKNYGDYIKHQVADIHELRRNPGKVQSIVNNRAGKVVLKIYNGKCGQHILIQSSEEFRDQDLLSFMEKNKFDIAEEFIIQHPSFSALSPSAVNTVRIYSQLNGLNQVEILGCRLRISVNSIVDNMAAGNLAAPIDDATGEVTGPGVYGDITKLPERIHPVTGTPIVGFQVPFWEETLEMVKRATLAHPQNRSIGWDIAMTENGPDLIEGNHDWCKLVWQLPVNQGLKAVLDRHLTEFHILK